ncbi:translation initiation factor eIF3 subunit g [Coemansia javaensis]|uniref:Eukaryotic translation initiation factor 3 subunit G n=1 Tax=Coemansia javaensis TaxID=2761396 RepID=A0A9W8LKX0_9FUNG|nr:translation initiation factor eIF3 subunit g [Coemansia javaensis]
MNKTSWADEVDEPQAVPERQVIANADGTKTVIEHRLNDDGKLVKQTRRMRDKVVQEHVNRAVASRKKWAKFGAEAGSPAGPQLSTTTVGEVVWLKLSQYAAQQKQAEQEAAEQEKTIKLKNTRILCRICRQDHFTAKCPYKDTLVPLEEITGAAGAGAAPAADDASAAPAAEAKSSYVPPHLRAGGRGASSSLDALGERRDDLPKIRITNLSEYTQEEDIKQLCRPFGPVSRAFLATDRETRLCKGYAFVTFYDYDAAERAIAKLHGYGFDHLILNVEWAGPRQ